MPDRLISQRWVVMAYPLIMGEVPKLGEKFLVNNTPLFGTSPIELFGHDGLNTRQLYEEYVQYGGAAGQTGLLNAIQIEIQNRISAIDAEALARAAKDLDLQQQITEVRRNAPHMVGFVSIDDPASRPSAVIHDNDLWITAVTNPMTFPVTGVQMRLGGTWVTAPDYTPETFDLLSNLNDDHGYYWFGADWNIQDFYLNVEDYRLKTDQDELDALKAPVNNPDFTGRPLAPLNDKTAQRQLLVTENFWELKDMILQAAGAIRGTYNGLRRVTEDGDTRQIEDASRIPVMYISLDQTYIMFNNQYTQSQIIALVLPENASNKTVLWSTGDSAVATVSDGLVTAAGNGECEITATTEDGAYSAVCSVVVNL